MWSLFCNAVFSVHLFSFVVISTRKRAGCFTLIVFLLLRGCYCSVSLPHCAIGWYVVCDCGIFRPCSLTV